VKKLSFAVACLAAAPALATTFLSTSPVGTLDLAYEAAMQSIGKAWAAGDAQVKTFCFASRNGKWSARVVYECYAASCDVRPAPDRPAQPAGPVPKPHPHPFGLRPPGEVRLMTALDSALWEKHEPAFKAGKAWIEDVGRHGNIRIDDFCLEPQPHGTWRAAIYYTQGY
jgi:hypothetical protein